MVVNLYFTHRCSIWRRRVCAGPALRPAWTGGAGRAGGPRDPEDWPPCWAGRPPADGGSWVSGAPRASAAVGRASVAAASGGPAFVAGNKEDFLVTFSRISREITIGTRTSGANARQINYVAHLWLMRRTLNHLDRGCALTSIATKIYITGNSPSGPLIIYPVITKETRQSGRRG